MELEAKLSELFSKTDRRSSGGGWNIEAEMQKIQTQYNQHMKKKNKDHQFVKFEFNKNNYDSDTMNTIANEEIQTVIFKKWKQLPMYLKWKSITVYLNKNDMEHRLVEAKKRLLADKLEVSYDHDKQEVTDIMF
jgi:hypothetical protein